MLINFASQYIPVFKYDYKVANIKNIQVKKHLLFSDNQNTFKNYNDLLNEENTDVYQINQSDKCEVIHIAVICGGYSSNIFLYTMLKSIYFYRTNPIHFHIVVNNLSKKVLKSLFDTWAVPQVSVTFYNMSDSVSDVRWVPNGHYSGIYGLLKLVIPKIVPLNITNKVIVLDTDLTFTSDIYELWKLFDNFKLNQVIGIVENQSDYYLKKTSIIPWPAVGKGYNTGVMLYRLDRLRKLGWDQLWSGLTKRTASIFGATRLGDQDIVNAIIYENKNIVYTVPCQWNTQLSDCTHSDNCYNRNQIKVVHWNSPKKLNVLNKDITYFRSLYTTFLELNGNLLRRQLFNCSVNNSRNITEQFVDVCSDFRKAQNSQWRTLLFFREYKYIPSKDDVAYVGQLSFDRLQIIEELSKYWEGPISLTLYVTDPELQQCIEFIKNSVVLQDRVNIAYHAVFKHGTYYPVNELRNIGLKNVNTPYVFLADGDFLPMAGLYSVLKKYVAPLKGLDKKALIVPAFETQRYKTSLPKTKNELLEMMDKKTIFTFRYDVWPVGHLPVNYVKWKSAQYPYKVKWQPDFEPFIVVHSSVTSFDRRFVGFGWNKVSHIMELEAEGYEFVVLPNAYIVHKSHAPSYDIGKFRTSPIYRMCLQNLKEEFVEMLHKKYGRVFNQKDNLLTIGSGM